MANWHKKDCVSRQWVGWRLREAAAAVLPLPAPGGANTGKKI